MTLQSMTGFARADGTLGGTVWHWELKSVNNRGLDVRLKLPAGFDALEPKVREGLSKRFSRGSIAVNLAVSRETGMAEIRINKDALAHVMRAAENIRQATGGAPPSPEGLLALKGVLEVVDTTEDESQTAALHAAMTQSLETALDALATARRAEGQRLKTVLEAQVGEIARLVTAVESAPGRTPDAIKARLTEQVARLMETGKAFDPLRLHQEAVMIATRADVEEEVKRLHAHLEAARQLLAEPGAVGRKLDFLAQEFFREANTLTSKAADADIAKAGLSLKIVVDQMREQVQNIE